jgi:hypothetical protein
MKFVVINYEVELLHLFDAMRTEMRKQLKQSIEVNSFL